MTFSAAPASVADCAPNDWSPTVKNWVTENVNEKFSSRALNLISDPPTSLIAEYFPIKLPWIFSGFEARSDVKELAGQLISIGEDGKSANCELLVGENSQCLKPPTVTDACE